jgi:cell division protein FtsI (penicillin-binding protein 3)
MGLQDAIYLLENQGMAVQIQGKGKVQKQSLTPGTKIYRGQNIILQLS